MKLPDPDKKLSIPSWAWPGGLLLGVALAYLPVFNNDFVNWDDKDAILENTQIRHLDLAFLKWSFTTYLTGNWIPLTWFSFALDHSVNGLDPRVFHATNLGLHLLDTVLVFLVCRRLLDRAGWSSIPAAFLTALLFGLHPIHVESVAWATERKDVLYALFYLLALFLYLGPNGASRNPRVLWVCGGLYILSFMAKPMAITLPVILLILDYWPLGRRDPLPALKEKTGLFVLAAAGTLVTFLSHAKTLSYSQSGVEFYWVLNAFRSLFFYLWKMLWPVGLCAYYPFPNEASAGYVAWNLALTALALGLMVQAYRSREKFPYLAAAGAYYLVSLLPVLGFVQTGAQAAADRYAYLPSLAPFLLFSVLAVRTLRAWPALFGAMTLVLWIGSAFMTRAQVGTWHDTRTLWQRVTETYPSENADAYNRLGAAYLKAKRYDEALAAFSRASAIPPPMARTFHGLGTALTFKDRVPEAIQSFQYALSLDPNMVGPRLNLWVIYEKMGKHEEAVGQMREALKVTPKDPQFQDNLGVSLTFLKRYGEAGTAFEAAHRMDPAKPEFLVNLATLRHWQGRTAESLSLYRAAAARDPKEPVYELKMADLYLAEGKKAKAREALERAWELRPTNPKVLRQIGEDFQILGEAQKAAESFEAAKRAAGSVRDPGVIQP